VLSKALSPTAIIRLFCFLAHLCWSTFALNASAIDVLLATQAKININPAPYWVSEKLDGVRAVWDGQQLRTRNGTLIQTPAWFVENFPKRALDGELWMGRGQFDTVSGVVRQQIPDEFLWRKVQYCIFELPAGEGTFSQRIIEMRHIVEAVNVPWLQAVNQFRLLNNQQLRQKLKQIVSEGGEGLMLHWADAPYVTGRSEMLLKLKPFEDAEARVIAYQAGKGKYVGKLGALLLEMPSGVQFKIGSGLTDAQRASPPPIGSSITYRYANLTRNGRPRFPRFLRIRPAE
jgi:DNA ligase-1